MNFNKYIIFTFIVTALILGCSFRTMPNNGQKDALIGTYRYLKDSVPNANSKFFEEIQLKPDGSFTYKNRIGSFIKNEVNGNWKLEGSNLLLNSPTSQKDVIEAIPCPSDNNGDLGYYVKVRNQKGHKINYMLIVDGNESNIIKEQYDNSSIKNVSSVENIQVITTFGLYSKVLALPDNSDEKRCFEVTVNEKRSFDNEEWTFVDSKVKPKAYNRKSAKYYLYKVE
jgi:hypothetical protein